MIDYAKADDTDHCLIILQIDRAINHRDSASSVYDALPAGDCPGNIVSSNSGANRLAISLLMLLLWQISLSPRPDRGVR